MSEWIIDLRDVEDAKDLALEINPNSTLIDSMDRTNEGNEPWICVCGKCDICGYKMVFFAQASIYEGGIEGVECGDCESMSVYPQERDSNEE